MSDEPISDPLVTWVSRVIVAGTALSIGTVALGVVLTLAAGGTDPDPERGLGLVDQLVAGKPASIVAGGLLLLALTPVAQLAAAAAAFARRGEHRYVVISSLVLVLLAGGIAAATVFSRAAGG